MAITDLKFSEADFAPGSGNTISELADKPQISAAELKARFDKMGKTLIALGRMNGLIDALAAIGDGTAGADNIGATAIDGASGSTVQSILEYLAAGKFDKSAVVQRTGSSTSDVMSQKALTDVLAETGHGDMFKTIYDTNDDGAVDDADKLGGAVAGEYLRRDGSVAMTGALVLPGKSGGCVSLAGAAEGSEEKATLTVGAKSLVAMSGGSLKWDDTELTLMGAKLLWSGSATTGATITGAHDLTKYDLFLIRVDNLCAYCARHQNESNTIWGGNIRPGNDGTYYAGVWMTAASDTGATLNLVSGWKESNANGAISRTTLANQMVTAIYGIM